MTLVGIHLHLSLLFHQLYHILLENVLVEVVGHVGELGLCVDRDWRLDWQVVVKGRIFGGEERSKH